jgi:DNA ligase 1
MFVTRPMLAKKVKDASLIRFPCFGTPKFDGIRCLKLRGEVLSRSFKLIPNEHVQELVSKLPDGLDGELILPGADFSEVQSAIMSRDGRPDFKYAVFDYANSTLGYNDRHRQLYSLELPDWVQIVQPSNLESVDAFLRYDEECIAAGYEGVITRSITGPYLCGRSTLRDQHMLKWKAYADSEAVVFGFVEARENTNPIVPNAFGFAKRPGGAVGKVPKGTLGAFRVRDIHSGIEFEIGTGIGLTANLRQRIWDDQPSYLGKIVHYRYQACGTKDRPRFPSFQGFRHEADVTVESGPAT